MANFKSAPGTGESGFMTVRASSDFDPSDWIFNATGIEVSNTAVMTGVLVLSVGLLLYAFWPRKMKRRDFEGYLPKSGTRLR